METLLSNLILVSCILVFLNLAWKVVNWVWITPKKMEKILRANGFRGRPYRFLVGDLLETGNLLKENSKPINFTNDIIPKIMPLLSNLVHDYGKKTYTWMGPKATMLILEPDEIREVLAKNYVYQKLTTNPLSRLLTGGMVGYDKDKWAKHRRIVNPAFYPERLKLMLPAFHLCSSEMLRKWDMMASSAEQGSFELDVWPDIQTLTSDSISRTAFGSNYEEGTRIFELQKELSDHILHLMNKVYIPYILHIPTKRTRRMKAIDKEVRTSISRIINGRMKAIQEKGSSGDDLLGIMLESNLKEIREQGSKKSGMSLEEVIEECKLFYFAGQETTANLIVWALLLLGKHSDWQERARDEVCQVFGANKPDYEGLNHLKVMNMILYEVLRLYPPGVLMGRMIHQDTVLGGKTLPAGMQLFMPIIMVHHDENFWGADAKEFKPERFSEGVANATKGQHIYFPFSSGPRVCIGQNFAVLETKMVLAMILQSYSFEISSQYAHAPYMVITMLPQHGTHLILHKL